MTQSPNLKSYIAATIAAVAISGGLTMTAFTAANASEPVIAVAMASKAKTGEFTKATFNIKGEWEILQQNGQTIFRLSENFKTKTGPDLKLFLSPKRVDTVTGRTATTDAIRLGALKSNKGTQDYIIPANIDLSQFGSILIHCEAYSKLWGGANL